MPTNEKISLNYDHDTTYTITVNNQVGTDSDFDSLYSGTTPIRTTPTITGDTAFVRKFGLAHTIKNLDTTTGLSDPGVVGLTWTVKTANTSTTYGSRANGGAFVDGSTTTNSTAIVLEVTNSGATTVLPATMTMHDADFGTLTVNLPTESVYNTTTALSFYVAISGSSYYNSDLKHGGARHTPTLTSSRLPYFDIATAYAALASTNDDAVKILDSETYDEDLTADNQSLDGRQTTIYSKVNQFPIITRGIGSRTTRNVTTQYNNTTAIYFNENGNDANAGIWQAPKLTIAGAIAARTTEDIVYGGTGATANGGGFPENVTLAASYTLEADYGYSPLINPSTGSGVSFTIAGPNLYGFRISVGSTEKCIGINSGVDFNSNIKNNSFLAGLYGIHFSSNTNQPAPAGMISYNYFNNLSDTGIFMSMSGAALNIAHTVEYNIFNTMKYGISYSITLGATNTSIINDNLVYGCSVIGITQNEGAVGQTWAGTIINNTIAHNTRGIEVSITNLGAYTIRDNIVYYSDSSDYDLYATLASPTITESNYGTNSGFTIGAGCITTDPKFCKNTVPYELGISADSGAYRTGTSSEDMGAHFRIIEIDNTTIELNGLIIDGNSQMNTAIFIKDNFDHTNLSVKYCKIKDFQGIGIDLYDADSDTNTTISNNLIENCGNGIKFVRGGNTIEENCIYNNTIFGVHADYTGNSFDHNVFFGNQYGIYFEGNSTGMTVKNNIFHNNSLYSIFSDTLVEVTYCCDTDAVNANVDRSATSNITNNPLFVNTTSGSENFNIKTVEGGNWNTDGYSYNSACKDAADDSKDIGAYDLTRAVNNDYWQKHQFTYNPRVVEYSINSKGNITFNNGLGTQWIWGKGRRRGFRLQWQTGQYSDETDRLKVEYFNSLYQRADNQVIDENVKVRFHPLLSQSIDSGTSATVSATDKTITDSAKSLIEDEYKGYHVGVKYTSGSATGTITAATKKLLVAPSPTWTNDEWIGYYFPYNGYYYYITDNDADELTLSDPDSTLSDASNINWTIEKYFKITSNTATVLTVNDDDSNLVAGTYDWIIRFMECHVISPNMSYSQPRYYYQKETWKTGYNMYLEEV